MTTVEPTGDGGAIGTNWAGNHTYRAARLVRPRTLDELREVVASLRGRAGHRLAALLLRPHRHRRHARSTSPGSRPASGSTRRAATVSVSGGVRYGDLAVALEEQGWALAAMASLPHISVAGAVATGTHGSGDRTGVARGRPCAALEVVGPDGAAAPAARADPDFAGSVVALGALGVVTRLELDVEPTYEVSPGGAHRADLAACSRSTSTTSPPPPTA